MDRGEAQHAPKLVVVESQQWRWLLPLQSLLVERVQVMGCAFR